MEIDSSTHAQFATAKERERERVCVCVCAIDMKSTATTAAHPPTHTLVGTGLLLDGLVRGNALQEILSALALLDVLNSDMDALGNDSVANTLVYDDTDGAGGDVPDLAGAAVVELVGHTLVDGTIGLDVDKVTDLVVDKVGRQVWRTILPEGARELGTGVRAVTR
jgi:hypothetical protein